MTASVTVLQSEPCSPARWISCGPATHRPSRDKPRRARQAWLSAHRSCDGRPGTMRQRPRCARDLGSDAGCNEYSKTSHSLITSDKDIKTPKYHFASMRKYISVDIRLAILMQFSDDRPHRERIAVGCIGTALRVQGQRPRQLCSQRKAIDARGETPNSAWCHRPGWPRSPV